MKGIAVLLPVLVALQVGVQPALAWAWPVDGPVLRHFVLGDDPYAGGQHRGIDIGASANAPVRAPAPGTISFAGTVPGGGKTITIRTADGYAVTLLHLGSYDVARGETVGEGDPVGSVASTGAPAEPQPYVYLGVRRADDPQGYVDPLGLLPQAAPPEAPTPPPEPEPEPEPVLTPAAQGAKGTPAGAHPSGRAHPVVRHTRVSAAGAERVTAVPGAEERGRVQRSAGGRSVARAAHEVQWRSSRIHAPTRDAGVPPGVPVRSAVLSVQEEGGAIPLRWLVAAFAAAGLGLGAVLAGRRELGDAGPADRAAPVLLQPVAAATEDAHRLRLREEDHVVLDRDLERILLGERKALADLDRDHDPTEIVDVADDPRSRRSSGRAHGRGSLGASVRPHVTSSPRSRRASCNTSPRVPVSNHDFRSREGVACFV
jgi:Peptidase family M23